MKACLHPTVARSLVRSFSRSPFNDDEVSCLTAHATATTISTAATRTLSTTLPLSRRSGCPAHSGRFRDSGERRRGVGGQARRTRYDATRGATRSLYLLRGLALHGSSAEGGPASCGGDLRPECHETVSSTQRRNQRTPPASSRLWSALINETRSRRRRPDCPFARQGSR